MLLASRQTAGYKTPLPCGGGDSHYGDDSSGWLVGCGHDTKRVCCGGKSFNAMTLKLFDVDATIKPLRYGDDSETVCCGHDTQAVCRGDDCSSF